jgi:DNA-binding transcriptional regulator YiaG
MKKDATSIVVDTAGSALTRRHFSSGVNVMQNGIKMLNIMQPRSQSQVCSSSYTNLLDKLSGILCMSDVYDNADCPIESDDSMAKKLKRAKYPPLKPAEWRATRKQLELSNYAFRRVVGVSLRSAQRYENGESNPPEAVSRFVRTIFRNNLKIEDIG